MANIWYWWRKTGSGEPRREAIVDEARVYLGVDPGKNGGAALLDEGGGIVEVWRWREGKDPLSSYNLLLKYAGYKSIYSYI